MTESPPRPRAIIAMLILALAFLAATASPARAQYGAGPSVFVDPVQVPVGSSFSVLGTSCPAGSIVTITIDTIPGDMGTAVADASGIFSLGSIPAPIEFVAGTTYTLRATCLTLVATTIFDAVCADGLAPVGGTCPAPGDSGGTQTTPDGGTPSGGTPTDGTDTIAFTGAGRTTQLAQLGATLLGMGTMLLLGVRRRRDEAFA